MVAVSGTKNSSTAESGSTSAPIMKLVAAESPSGSHTIDDSNGCAPRCSVEMAEINTMMAITHVVRIAATETTSLSVLLPRVNSRMVKNATSGGSGINQTRSSGFM